MFPSFPWFVCYLNLTATNGEIAQHAFDFRGSDIVRNETVAWAYNVTGLNAATNYTATLQIYSVYISLNETFGNISLPSNYAITGN